MNRYIKLYILIPVLAYNLVLPGIGLAEEVPGIPVIDQDKLAVAIYLAEGGENTRFPYGIKSVDTHGDKAYARKICLNTINNNLARWQWARQNGDKRDYIAFLGSRYAPTKGATDDPMGLNNNWVNNVRRLYA